MFKLFTDVGEKESQMFHSLISRPQVLVRLEIEPRPFAPKSGSQSPKLATMLDPEWKILNFFILFIAGFQKSFIREY